MKRRDVLKAFAYGDVTNMWDPKGSEVVFRGGSVNNYSQNDIRQVGNIRYAAVPPGVATSDMLDTFTQKILVKCWWLTALTRARRFK